MFKSLAEDRDDLRRIFTPWREWESPEEAFRLNTYSVQMFCLIFQYVQFNCEPGDYKINGFRAYKDETGIMTPESLQLIFGQRGQPQNHIWMQDGLISWTRDRADDIPLVGVPALQRFIKSLHAN